MSIHECSVYGYIKRQCHVPLGKSYNPFVPQLLHLKNGDNITYSIGL